MKLRKLQPRWLTTIDEKSFRESRAARFSNKIDGIIFLCPKCFTTNKGPKGTHSVICWRPHVPQTIGPKPGRWEFEGSGFDDLTLVAGSSSVQLTAGCKAHFFIKKGIIAY